ncbi:MAG TPA: SCO family protein [Thermoleophilaceae bacterium]|nr:SCO family protein [Thermoleophilaceae bacterium]
MKTRLPILAVLLLVALLAGCGSSDSEKSDKPAVETKPSPFQGAVADPPKPAPPLQLKDSTGQTFDLAKYRGKAVLVTFLYVHCPDICPLMASNLHTALKQLGPQASRVQVVAVSTDPKGDTPKTVKKFLASHQVTDEMRYLLGSKSQLADVWKQWGIISRRDRTDPEKVEHSSPIYGISASGKITTLYPANFKPAQIVHDAPLLAKQ